MIEQQLYNVSLLIAAVANVVMGCSLINGNYTYRDYPVYRRSRMFTALIFLIFAVGFVAHTRLGWRATWPAGASALTVSYFHVAGVLFSWSHISLLNPQYLIKEVVLRDVLILIIAITIYWIAAFSPLSTYHSQISFSLFFVHALYISSVLYSTLHRVRRLTKMVPKSSLNSRWWTEENRTGVILFQHSMGKSYHLIVIFGIGSVILTALFPHDVWPYTILMTIGIAVFSYIFYSLTEYGSVIEAGTNVTEDLALLYEDY